MRKNNPHGQVGGNPGTKPNPIKDQKKEENNEYWELPLFFVSGSLGGAVLYFFLRLLIKYLVALSPVDDLLSEIHKRVKKLIVEKNTEFSKYNKSLVDELYKKEEEILVYFCSSDDTSKDRASINVYRNMVCYLVGSGHDFRKDFYNVKNITAYIGESLDFPRHVFFEAEGFIGVATISYDCFNKVQKVERIPVQKKCDWDDLQKRNRTSFRQTHAAVDNSMAKKKLFKRCLQGTGKTIILGNGVVINHPLVDLVYSEVKKERKKLISTRASFMS